MEWVGESRVLGSTRRVQYALVTASLFGIQFVWSVQQVYVNLELLRLGLAKSELSLIWTASPLAGLLVQPVVGSLSDACTSAHGRRRPFIVWGALLTAAGMLALAWAQSVAGVLGTYPWAVAVGAVLVVDIAVNTCQAASRALVVDVFPGPQQKEAMATASVMVAVGHLVAYGLGRLRWVKLGFDTRLQGVCVLFAGILLVCVAVSAAAVQELVLIRPLRADSDVAGPVFAPKAALRKVWTNVVHLDEQLKGIFTVQLFAWYGWFTFLFYGATFAAEVWQGARTTPPDPEEMAMAGSFAMFVFAATATLFAIVLTHLEPEMLNTWIVGALVYASAMAVVRLVTTYTAVLMLFGAVGFAWAVTQWVPFALTSQRIHELPPTADPHAPGEASETITVLNDHESQVDTTERGGVILGIHNCALTIPQFVSTFGSYLIYRLLDADPENPHSDGGRATAVTLQAGAFTALLAAAYIHRLKGMMRPQL